MFRFIKDRYGVIFPGDPEYDAPNPTRDWHYAIIFTAIFVVFFTLIVYDFTHQGMGKLLIGASLVTFAVSLFTAPYDPRYP